MDEKFRDAHSEKAAIGEYVSSVTFLWWRHSWLIIVQIQYAAQQQEAEQAPRQFTPEAGPSNAPSYAPPSYAPPSPAPPSPASAVPTVPTNGVNVSTVFENIRGLWECFDECMVSMLTHAPLFPRFSAT